MVFDLILLVKADGSPDGQAIFEHRCNQCHALPDPGAYSDGQWARLVKRYGPRAGIRPEWRTAVITWLQEINDPQRPRDTEAR